MVLTCQVVLLCLLPQVQKQVILGQAHLRFVARTEGTAHSHHRVALAKRLGWEARVSIGIFVQVVEVVELKIIDG